MFFGLFGKKEKKIKFGDLTFMHEKAKMNAVLKTAAENGSSVFIAWFPATLEKYREAFRANHLQDSRVLDARQFHSARVADNSIFMLEHHPLRNREETLFAGLEDKKITVFNALDEALFSMFGGEKMIDLMQKLGLREDEALDHNLISRSIERAQEKIAGKVITESSAASQKEWIEKNVK